MAVGSVVDYLKKTGKNSSFGNRKKLASQYGINDYKGTASQNISLLNKLRSTDTAGTNTSLRPNIPSVLNNQNVNAGPGVINTSSSPNVMRIPSSSSKVNSGYSYKSVDNLNKPVFTPSRETYDYANKLRGMENNRPDPFSSRYTKQIDDILANINNPKKFDINTDENYKQLYENMREKYLYEGQKAMRDAQGQISSLSGGYGSSYAGSVASQAYDDYMTKLNENNMALYQMAYDSYWKNRNDSYNQLEAFRGQDNIDYSRYRDNVGDYYRDREYLANRYDNSYNRDYGLYSGDLNQYNQESKMAFEQEEARRNQANADRDFAYRQEQDNIANSLAMARLNKSGGAGSGGGGSRVSKGATSAKVKAKTATSTKGKGVNRNEKRDFISVLICTASLQKIKFLFISSSCI